MHSFIVSDPPPITSQFSVLEIHPDPSVTIDHVRAVQNFLSRKPTQGNTALVIIHSAHLLTLPAQHALLKTLEEPPSYAQIYLVTPFPDQLLSTILSRCQLSSSAVSISYSQKDLEKIRALLNQFLSAGVGERLALLDAQNFTRDTALQFLDQLEYLLHHHLTTGDLSLPFDYSLLSQTRIYLKANTNVKLTLDNFILHLSHTES